ncbi:hypothetical protein G6011_05197 [Alternaria panax]|uniref:Uncharacterized protein n=1 Tax=Alternaria panax TaxID=48097 RepID=A0AAD4FD00_9PLEO|nr:hypothetical protein G6011_05197 [Alternaria panax]
MLCATTMMERKRSPKERIVKKTPSSKAHITRQPLSPRRRQHPAARTKNSREKTPRRIDITPLPRSRLAQKPLGLHYTKDKSSWNTLLYAYMLEMSYLKDVEMRSSPSLPLSSQYEQDMVCDYNTMDSRFAFHMSGGVFGYPHPAFGLSTSGINSFGSSTRSGNTPSCFSAITLSSPVSSQSDAAAISGSTGSMTEGDSKPWTSDIEMDDAPDASTDHVAIAPIVATVTVPVLPLLQPPKPSTTMAATPPIFAGLTYLPSKFLTTETVTPPKPAAMSGDQVSAKLPSAPQIPNPVTSAIALSLTLPSRDEEAAKTPKNLQPPTPADGTKSAVSPPKVEITEPAKYAQMAKEIKPSAISALSDGSTAPIRLILVGSSKPTVPPSTVADTNAPKETSRPKTRPRGRAMVPLVEPGEASKQEVELGMGSFASSHIQSPAAQVSAFSNPHFKQLFSDEIKTLEASLLKQEEIQGSQVIFLLRSLKWVTESHDDGWFEDEIELENDVAYWRGKLNILTARLEKYEGPDVNGIVANTRVQLEKVFVILGGADKLDPEIA